MVRQVFDALVAQQEKGRIVADAPSAIESRTGCFLEASGCAFESVHCLLGGRSLRAACRNNSRGCIARRQACFVQSVFISSNCLGIKLVRAHYAPIVRR